MLMHVEHDVEVTWAALKAWAEDDALLEPLGLQRGFVRTEIAPWSGGLVVADAQTPVIVFPLIAPGPLYPP